MNQCFFVQTKCRYNSLKLTYPLKIGHLPQKEMIVTIVFQPSISGANLLLVSGSWVSQPRPQKTHKAAHLVFVVGRLAIAHILAEKIHQVQLQPIGFC